LFIITYLSILTDYPPSPLNSKSNKLYININININIINVNNNNNNILVVKTERATKILFNQIYKSNKPKGKEEKKKKKGKTTIDR